MPARARSSSGPAVYTDAFQSDPDPRYRATLAGYDSITAETAMKIADAAAAARAVRLRGRRRDGRLRRRTHGQQVFGHTLSWCTDSTLPGWLRNGSWSRASLLSVLEQHITAVMTHFRGRVSAWDVVNEALNDDGTRRNCLWKRVIGDDWVEQAFRFARQADPGAKLFYNETRADVPNPKYEATVGLVRDLRARGVPVDGVGLQYHLTDRMPDPGPGRGGDLAGWATSVWTCTSVSWTFRSGIWAARPERKLARQAAVYRTVAAACHAQPACFRITTWGFTDRYTWRQPWEHEPAAAVRLRVPAEAGVDGDPGGAPPGRHPAPASASSGGAAAPIGPCDGRCATRFVRRRDRAAEAERAASPPAPAHLAGTAGACGHGCRSAAAGLRESISSRACAAA